MESHEYHWAAAVLAWQYELGADEAICETPVNRYDLPDRLPKKSKPKAQENAQKPQSAPKVDPVAVARQMASSAQDLGSLEQTLAAFDLCELKRGARHTLFGQGSENAAVMVIADAPNRDDDRSGQFFHGAAGQLFDKMFDAIGLSREGENAALYLSYAMPWRPPQDREARVDELETLQPFLTRQIEIIDPKVLILMGNNACQSLLGQRGITRLRGTWQQVLNRPALAMLSPAQLMRNPQSKRDAWADLLSVKSKLNET